MIKREPSRSFARYLIRMSTRPTPYGAFAGISLLRWGDRTTLTVRNDKDRIRTRPDMGSLVGLCLALDADATVRAESPWMINARAVERHGRLSLADSAEEYWFGQADRCGARGSATRPATRAVCPAAGAPSRAHRACQASRTAADPAVAATPPRHGPKTEAPLPAVQRQTCSSGLCRPRSRAPRPSARWRRLRDALSLSAPSTGTPGASTRMANAPAHFTQQPTRCSRPTWLGRSEVTSSMPRWAKSAPGRPSFCFACHPSRWRPLISSISSCVRRALWP